MGDDRSRGHHHSRRPRGPVGRHRREPIVFTVATLGAVLFGVLTVADAWVLGWATQHVLIPAFDTGEIGTDMLLWVVALFMGVAILRAVGIVARRLGGGIMYYRMQSHTRRGVTRQYPPCRWRDYRHPTGQLLSNAYWTSRRRPRSCPCRWRSAPW